MSKMNIFVKIISFSFFFFSFCVSSFAASVPVEKVFRDIDKNYKYYNELQALYDKGMIFPDKERKFNPKKLLARDEFMGIMSEVSCKKCIQPKVDFKFINEYSGIQSFFDLPKQNKFFYCIESAKGSKQVSGYDIGTTCDDGTYRKDKRPFCPNNTIILEEAIAIILRAGNILSKREADFERSKLLNQKNISLADDVNSKISGGQVYSFFPDLKKALEHELIEYDTDGNKKVYKLLEKKNNKIYPKKAISKEEFLKIAYVALKTNSCVANFQDEFAVQINVFDKSCKQKYADTCKISSLKGKKTIYDFQADVGIYKNIDFSNPNNFVWRFYKKQTGEEIIRKGSYIDDYDFLNDGSYRVNLTVFNKNGDTAEAYTDIHILRSDSNSTQNNVKVSIYANPIQGPTGVEILFKGIVSTSNGIIGYEWNLGDGNIKNGQDIKHTFRNPGVYPVTFTVRDNKGNEYKSKIVIRVLDPLLDSDGDGVPDYKDNEVYTPPKLVPTICTESDISSKRYGCKPKDLGVGNPNKIPNTDELDDDNDGVLNGVDKCRLEPGKPENDGCPIMDRDGDTVIDNVDVCPDIPGDVKNFGCPIEEKKCKINKDCEVGFFCKDTVCVPQKFTTNCYYRGGDLIYGNVICDTCPCRYSFDFNSKVKKCDVLFPAITSPKEDRVYSKGKYLQIAK